MEGFVEPQPGQHKAEAHGTGQQGDRTALQRGLITLEQAA
jgi:hypothetical protein